MDSSRASIEVPDPLERRLRSKLVVLLTVLATGLAFILSARREDPAKLPGIALDAPFLLDLERAAFVGAVVAGASIFLIRGWAGYFPSKLSTTGAEYAVRPAIDKVAESGESALREIHRLKSDQVAAEGGTRVRLDSLEAQLRALADRVEELRRGDDML